MCEAMLAYLVSHLPPVSTTIQSSFRPRKRYFPASTSAKRSPVWKCPSECRSETSGQLTESDKTTSSKSWPVEPWLAAVGVGSSSLVSVGKKAYDVPSKGTKKDASRPCPPTDIKRAPVSVHPYAFYRFQDQRGCFFSDS